MTQQGHGNFAFLLEKDPVTYMDMLDLESQLRIDYHWTGVRIQGALEIIVQKVVEKNGLQKMLPKHLTLTRQLLKLLNYRVLALSHPVLPCAEEVVRFTVINADGKSETSQDTCYAFLRALGSAFRSGQRTPLTPETSYPNTVLALRLLHKILVKLYDAGSVPTFDTDRMPYGPYIVDAVDEPADLQGDCLWEVLAHTETTDGKPDKYALLRVYQNNPLKPELQQKREDRYWQIQKACPGTGMPALQKLTPNTKDLPFFVMAYIFHQDCQMLTNRMLKIMELPQRITLCKFLAHAFLRLHQRSVYHGGVDPSCIFLFGATTCPVPFVTKFDRTPFLAEENMLDHAPMINIFLGRYVSPERCAGNQQVDPAKADVYSLGVLLGDILYGKFDANMTPGNTFFHVSRMSLPMPVARIIGQMLHEKPLLRPTMAQVAEAFEKEEA